MKTIASIQGQFVNRVVQATIKAMGRGSMPDQDVIADYYKDAHRQMMKLGFPAYKVDASMKQAGDMALATPERWKNNGALDKAIAEWQERVK